MTRRCSVNYRQTKLEQATNELMRDHVRFLLNGQEQIVRGNAAFVTLAEYCTQLRPAGNEITCAEGDCGACTVLVGRPTVQYFPVDACIQFIFQLDGACRHGGGITPMGICIQYSRRWSIATAHSAATVRRDS